jgi:hypothetical protein
MAKKTVGWVGFDDFQIYDGDSKIGTLRVKASGILWKPKGRHTWLKVSIEQFAEHAEKLDTWVKR